MSLSLNDIKPVPMPVHITLFQFSNPEFPVVSRNLTFFDSTIYGCQPFICSHCAAYLRELPVTPTSPSYPTSKCLLPTLDTELTHYSFGCDQLHYYLGCYTMGISRVQISLNSQFPAITSPRTFFIMYITLFSAFGLGSCLSK